MTSYVCYIRNVAISGEISSTVLKNVVCSAEMFNNKKNLNYVMSRFMVGTHRLQMA